MVDRARTTAAVAERSAPVQRLIASPAPGEALRPPVRRALERSFGVGLGGVRVHADRQTGAVVDALPARAFAYGTHVFLGSREQASDAALLAHETAHVLQQRGGSRVQTAAGIAGHDALEREAEQAARAAGQGEAVSVRGRTGGPTVQGSLTEWLEEKAWGILEEVAPELAPIIRQGVFAWLTERIGAAVESLFSTLMAPVRAVTGTVEAVSDLFSQLVGWMRDAATRIAKGDCSAVTEAAERIQRVIQGLAAPVIDRIGAIAKKVGDFFTGIWNRFGAPAWEFLKQIGGAAWEKVQQVVTWIWDKTAPIRNLAARAWRWVKNKLGIGEGPDGQNGILQWVQEKARDAWDAIKAKIEPIKKPLMVVAGVLVMLSPAGPFVAVGAAAAGLIKGIQWIQANLRSRDGVVRQRDTLRGVIIPAITNAINGVSSTLGRLAAGMSEKLGAVLGGLGQLVGAVGGSILSFAVGALKWVVEQFRGLVTWASQGLMALADLVRGGLDRLRAFLQPVFDVLGQIATVVGNVLQLPILVAGRLWNAIPACIRDPFVDFLVQHVLKHVPIFGELIADPEVWGKLKEGATRLVRQIFRDHDLLGAIRSVFQLLLTVLKIPIELVTGIYAKAVGVFDQIYRNPLGFLKNLLRAVKQGFSQFFGGIVGHLLGGVRDWLFGQIGQLNIRWPNDVSFRSVLGLVMDLLGVSVDTIFARLGKRIGDDKAAKLRRGLDLLTGALEWIGALVTEGPAGLWRRLMERIGDLWATVRDTIIGWMRSKIIAAVTQKILSMLDPTGVMAVVNSILAIYRAIQSAIEYAKQMLEFVNTVLDGVAGIAAGAIAPAAGFLERAMARAIPIAIGFLANQASLGKIGARIREIVQDVSAKLWEGIDWLIDQIVRLGQAVLGALGKGGTSATASAAPVHIETTFEMAGEDHRIVAEVRNGRLVVEMASGRLQELQGTLAGAIDAEKRSANRPVLLRRLNRTYEKLRGIEEDLVAARVNSEREREREALLLRRIADMAQNLIAVGIEFGIKNLINLGHASRFVRDDEIKSEFRGEQFRPTFYGGWNAIAQAHRERELRRLREEAKDQRWQGSPLYGKAGAFVVRDRQGQWEPYLADSTIGGNVHLDHVVEVARHWNSEGNNQIQDKRVTWNNDDKNLQVVDRLQNSRKGGPPRNYRVGKAFRGPDE